MKDYLQHITITRCYTLLMIVSTLFFGYEILKKLSFEMIYLLTTAIVLFTSFFFITRPRSPELRDDARKRRIRDEVITAPVIPTPTSQAPSINDAVRVYDDIIVEEEETTLVQDCGEVIAPPIIIQKTTEHTPRYEISTDGNVIEDKVGDYKDDDFSIGAGSGEVSAPPPVLSQKLEPPTLEDINITNTMGTYYDVCGKEETTLLSGYDDVTTPSANQKTMAQIIDSQTSGDESWSEGEAWSEGEEIEVEGDDIEIVRYRVRCDWLPETDQEKEVIIRYKANEPDPDTRRLREQVARIVKKKPENIYLRINVGDSDNEKEDEKETLYWLGRKGGEHYVDLEGNIRQDVRRQRCMTLTNADILPLCKKQTIFVLAKNLS